MSHEPTAPRLVLIEADVPDVIGTYVRAGWTIDEAGRWHAPGDDDDEASP